MALSKPYRRIIRPFLDEEPRPYGPDYSGGQLSESHLVDPEYAADRISLCRAYHLIENDLKTIFDYIEPADKNLKTFSHRLYQLFLRACTEFEASCRGVLGENGYKRSQSKWNIRDYCKLEQSSRLSEYEVEVAAWRGTNNVFRPFHAWSNGRNLQWYQDYNKVKHSRSQFFELANLESVLLATTGVLAILFSQFYTQCFDVWQPALRYCRDSDGWLWGNDTMFRIKPPTSWSDAECYDFEWKRIRSSSDRFQTYPF